MPQYGVFILYCVLCAWQSIAHNTHAILGHAATPPHNKLRCNLFVYIIEQYEVDVLYFLGIYSICLRRSCIENNFIFLHVKFVVHESEDSLCW